MKSRSEAVFLMNEWGAKRIPFLFFTDFEGERIFLEKLNNLNSSEIHYDFNDVSNQTNTTSKQIQFKKHPIRIETFALAFNKVVGEINYGNSFLTNLTFETPIEIDCSLDEIFGATKAKYRLKFKEDFVCFSPETFVSISGNQIRSFPMKGTIDATVPMAEKVILSDPKETAEHITIVDLIRNDLSQIAENVRVEKFRFVDEIQTGKGKLLQVSSEIVGDLRSDWQQEIGTLLFSLLPAGSISGAPKPKTIDIIKSAETHERKFYTGICGVFDGEKMDSGVMIRFIENRDGHYFYKSGGGITAFSNLEKEYQEYLDKIYVPLK